MAGPQRFPLDSDPAPDTAAPLPHRPVKQKSRFNSFHAAVFVICWLPLNPMIVVAVLSPRIILDLKPSTVIGILFTVLGPFAPRAAYHGAMLHGGLILWAAGILCSCVLVQVCWKPARRRFEIIRQAIWAAGWWSWFYSAYVAFVILM